MKIKFLNTIHDYPLNEICYAKSVFCKRRSLILNNGYGGNYITEKSILGSEPKCLHKDNFLSSFLTNFGAF